MDESGTIVALQLPNMYSYMKHLAVRCVLITLVGTLTFRSFGC